MSDYMMDLNGLTGAASSQSVTAKNSTNKKAGESLDMTDFLQLMVAMFQNQDMENTASTSEMMSQMVQMSVVQAITDITTVINDSTTMTYAASLVGKDVTIGQYVGGKLTEIQGTDTGTGLLNGQQVVFIGDKSYNLTDIMAVGKLPELKSDTDGETGSGAGSSTENGANQTDSV